MKQVIVFSILVFVMLTTVISTVYYYHLAQKNFEDTKTRLGITIMGVGLIIVLGLLGFVFLD